MAHIFLLLHTARFQEGLKRVLGIQALLEFVNPLLRHCAFLDVLCNRFPNWFSDTIAVSVADAYPQNLPFTRAVRQSSSVTFMVAKSVSLSIPEFPSNNPGSCLL
jgi:hypothetical protein